MGIYASKELAQGTQTHPINWNLVEFRKNTSNPEGFLTLLFWNDLWIYEDEFARRAHTRKVIERWMRVFDPRDE